MNGPGEYEEEMHVTGLLDDETIESIVTGDEVHARFDAIAAFARDARTMRDDPLPPPSAALEAVFAGRPATGRPRGSSFPTGKRRKLTSAAAKVAGLGAAAKIGLGSFAAAASVAAAGAGGALPGPATDGIRGAIETVTPIEFDDPASPGGSGGSGGSRSHDDQGQFGDRVSSDATGESDGRPGVDGQVISEEAPGAANRPDQPGERGQDRAGETPAATNTPAAPGGSDDPGPVGQTPGATAPGSSTATTRPAPAGSGGVQAPLHAGR